MSIEPASRPDQKASQPGGRLQLSASDAREAIFGSFDGMTSTLGVVAGLPALPFVFGSSTACVVASLAITLLAAAVIGHYRGYVVTYTILIVVSVLTVGLSIAVG